PCLPAQRAHAVYGRGLEELQRLVEHTATERAPLVEIDASRLLQDVDHCVGIASGRKPASRQAQDLQWSDLVAEVALGRRARADRNLVLAQQRDVVLGEVDRV